MIFLLERYLKDLEYIVNIDSGSADIDGNAKVASFFEERFKELGLETEHHRVGKLLRPVVIATTPHKGSSIPGKDYEFYLSGHMDTVFPKGTVAERPFKREGNRVFGPGCVDMKSGTLLILYLAEYLVKNMPEVSFMVLLNSDEELGSPDSTPIMRQEAAKCCRVFVFEGQRKQGQFVIERKGIAKFDIEVEGIASHAGAAPQEGVSAILELSKIVVDFSKLQKLDKGTSINVGLMEGGTALNVIPPHAKARMEVRYTSVGEFNRVLRAIAKMHENPHASGAKVKFTQISHYSPLVITRATKQMMDDLKPLNLQYVKAGGISDANRLACLGLATIDGCGPGGGFPHSEREFLDLDTVPARFDQLIEIIKKLPASPN